MQGTATAHRREEGRLVVGDRWPDGDGGGLAPAASGAIAGAGSQADYLHFP